MSVIDVVRSNSLVDLASRIKAEHEAVSIALKDSVRHAMAAGALLVEAKKQLKHGQWLPWLRDHCTISERTAQLYMRCAKGREKIEKQIRNGVADLSLNEAAAMLMLSSNVDKLMEFMKQIEHVTDSEQLMQICLDSGVASYEGTIDYDEGYTAKQRREWDVFILYLVRTFGAPPNEADEHVCWIKRHQYNTPSEWMGEEGDKHRRQMSYRKPISDEAKRWWQEILAETKGMSRADINMAIAKAAKANAQ